MTVSPKAQGKHIGLLLGGKAIINAAREEPELRVCILKSNTILKPAITLYEKLGFKRIVGRRVRMNELIFRWHLTLKRFRIKDLKLKTSTLFINK